MKEFSLFLGMVVFIGGSWFGSAALLWNVPVTVAQPNGEQLRLFASGDEFYNWLHDAKGYTIIQNPETGYYEYALLQNGALRPSGYPVSSLTQVNAATIVFLQIPPGLKTAWDRRVKPIDMLPGGPADIEHIVAAPKTGTINNMVIFIRFNDDPEFEADKRMLKLLRGFLNAGMMDNGLVSPTEEGTPQGGPLSPLLSNIMLDHLDRELERRGHRFVRYADDSNIYVQSKRAGLR